MPGYADQVVRRFGTEENFVLLKDFAELKAAVEELKRTSFKEVKLEPKTTEITIGIQLLIFHYLGFLNQLNIDNKSKSQLLSVLFKTEGVENLRKALSNVGGKNSKYMIEKNLLQVSELFEKVGLDEPLKKVRKDLEKLIIKQG
jgi:hypothetical protein